MPISISDIERIVASEDDFGHETRVGAAIKAIPNIKSQHGGTYTDSVTGKPRQFDFRCSLTKVTNGVMFTVGLRGETGWEPMSPIHQTIQLVMAVECKNLNPDFPLVVCGTNRREEEAFQDLIVCTGKTFFTRQSMQVPAGEHSQIYRAKSIQSFYRQGEFVGKSLLRLKPENSKSSVPVAGSDSDIYEKWAQSISSSVDLVVHSFEEARPNHRVVTAILPVVVVSDGSLWRVAYGDDGEASKPERVDQCEFYVGREIQGGDGFMMSHIHFFTLKAFASFLSKMSINDIAWETLFNPGLLRFGPS